ncbi:MAG: GGDEF domain-containing protein [Planctomycetota bacterium]|nr:GGDEF domain-containing protein [Planctomycetota bacterium]
MTGDTESSETRRVLDESRAGGEAVEPSFYTLEEMANLDRAELIRHCSELQRLCVQLDGEAKFISWELKESSEVLLRFAQVTKIAHYLTASDLENISTLAVNELPQYLNCRFAAFYLYDPISSVFTLDRASIPVPDVEATDEESAPGRFLHQLFTSGEAPYVIERNASGYEAGEGSGTPLKVTAPNPAWYDLLGETAMVFPLAINRTDDPPVRLGGLMLGNSEVRLTERDAEAAHMFVDLLSSSLHNAQLVRQLNQMATTDVLTHLNNRRQFLVEMDKALSQVSRNRHPLSLTLLDIDHFKVFNDAYGHHCGDMVLREMGTILTECLRKNLDIPARYGGEEFTVIMPFTDLCQAMRVAERIRREVEARTIVYGTKRLSVTCSLGVAEYREGDSAASLVDRADAALYCAKNSGRNRVSSKR